MFLGRNLSNFVSLNSTLIVPPLLGFYFMYQSYKWYNPHSLDHTGMHKFQAYFPQYFHVRIKKKGFWDCTVCIFEKMGELFQMVRIKG